MAEPLTARELDALRAISSPTVCNAIETFKVRPRNEGFMDSTIQCRFPELGVMAGYAVTAKIRARERPQQAPAPWDMWGAMEEVPKPWIVVIEDLDYPDPTGSFWGEVNGSIYQGLGAIGTVTNGGVRDLPEVRATGFHFFSSCVLVSHAYIHLVEVGGPVSVGGLTVNPGDLLHGDEHG
ncbi:MAG: RraA family protein, partial [Dehalococcoidia bacterium]